MTEIPGVTRLATPVEKAANRGLQLMAAVALARRTEGAAQHTQWRAERALIQHCWAFAAALEEK
jgi:hypothetical protein